MFVVLLTFRDALLAGIEMDRTVNVLQLVYAVLAPGVADEHSGGLPVVELLTLGHTQPHVVAVSPVRLAVELYKRLIHHLVATALGHVDFIKYAGTLLDFQVARAVAVLEGCLGAVGQSHKRGAAALEAALHYIRVEHTVLERDVNLAQAYQTAPLRSPASELAGEGAPLKDRCHGDVAVDFAHETAGGQTVLIGNPEVDVRAAVDNLRATGVALAVNDGGKGTVQLVAAPNGTGGLHVAHNGSTQTTERRAGLLGNVVATAFSNGKLQRVVVAVEDTAEGPLP